MSQKSAHLLKRAPSPFCLNFLCRVKIYSIQFPPASQDTCSLGHSWFIAGLSALNQWKIPCSCRSSLISLMIDQIVVVETCSLPEGFMHYLLSDKSERVQLLYLHQLALFRNWMWQHTKELPPIVWCSTHRHALFPDYSTTTVLQTKRIHFWKFWFQLLNPLFHTQIIKASKNPFG